MKTKILAALAQLDPTIDDHWTADGAPRLDVVAALSGEKVTRAEVTNADPEFNRDKARASATDNTPDVDAEVKEAERQRAEAEAAAADANENIDDDVQPDLPQIGDEDYSEPRDLDNLSPAEVLATPRSAQAAHDQLAAEAKIIKARIAADQALLEKKTYQMELIDRALARFKQKFEDPAKSIQEIIRRNNEDRENRVRSQREALASLDPSLAKRLNVGPSIDETLANRPRTPRNMNQAAGA